MLLEGGGNPNAANLENSTCLHEAIQNGDLEIIFMLLDYGGDITLRNNKKVTPLSFATPKMHKLLGIK
jgi:ankyrin repeat protein